MFSLLFQSGAGPATLFLVLCLNLGASNSQDSTDWKVMDMELQMPSTAKASEEVLVMLQLKTEMKECMVVKTYLQSDKPLEGNAGYKFTGCLCKDYPRKFFWDVATNSTMTIWAIADVIRQLNICPEDRAIIPIKSNRFMLAKTLKITSP